MAWPGHVPASSTNFLWQITYSTEDPNGSTCKIGWKQGILLLLMVQKSGDSNQLRLVVEIPLFTTYNGFIHPRWLFGISEPSTVFPCPSQLRDWTHLLRTLWTLIPPRPGSRFTWPRAYGSLTAKESLRIPFWGDVPRIWPIKAE